VTIDILGLLKEWPFRLMASVIALISFLPNIIGNDPWVWWHVVVKLGNAVMMPLIFWAIASTFQTDDKSET